MQLYPLLRRLTVKEGYERRMQIHGLIYNNTAETERLLTENYERYYRPGI